jgi:hypothetical protein
MDVEVTEDALRMFSGPNPEEDPEKLLNELGIKVIKKGKKAILAGFEEAKLA